MAGYTESPEKQKSISRAVALNDASLIVANLYITEFNTRDLADKTTTLADLLYQWLVKKEPDQTTEKTVDSLLEVMDKKPKSPYVPQTPEEIQEEQDLKF